MAPAPKRVNRTREGRAMIKRFNLTHQVCTERRSGVTEAENAGGLGFKNPEKAPSATVLRRRMVQKCIINQKN
jgi:hypothetical protein